MVLLVFQMLEMSVLTELRHFVIRAIPLKNGLGRGSFRFRNNGISPSKIFFNILSDSTVLLVFEMLKNIDFQ